RRAGGGAPAPPVLVRGGGRAAAARAGRQHVAQRVAGRLGARRAAPPTSAERALGALTPNLRAVAVLHLSGMTGDDMAAVLGIGRATVASRFGVAARVMGRALSGEAQDGRDEESGIRKGNAGG